METDANDNNKSKNDLLNLLADGKEETRRLLFQLDGPQHASAIRVQNIFNQVISIVSCMEPTCIRNMPNHSHNARSGSLGRSGSGSPRSEVSERMTRKRKDNVVKRTIQVHATTNNGPSDASAIPDDGYSWRKYGQKNILNAKYPRSYYRCTFQKSQNCQALKHVQRSDEDPEIFFVTYQGEHTCTQHAGQTSLAQPLDHQLLIPTPNEFNKQCMIEFDKPYLTIETHESCQDEQGKIHSPSFSITSAQAALRTENPDVFSPSSSFGGPFTSGFVPSGAPDSNYPSMFPSDFGGNFGGMPSFHGLECELNDVISMPHSGTSATYVFNPFNLPHPFK